MLKLKLQYLGHLMQRTYSLENTLMLEEKSTTEDETVVSMHHCLDGQGSLACCSP